MDGYPSAGKAERQDIIELFLDTAGTRTLQFLDEIGPKVLQS